VDAARTAVVETKIGAWSEENGMKKELRDLLSTLHMILWPEASWNPVRVDDILDDNKCMRCWTEATRLVRPLTPLAGDIEKRFLAKRIYETLAQAKIEFDNSSKKVPAKQVE
jgi:hypothetical protein